MNASMLGLSWEEALSEEFTKPYFVKLNTFVTKERAAPINIYPPPREVFSWSYHCDIKDIKVVIIGKEPHSQPALAHGLSYSVRYPNPSSPILKNIFKELRNDIPGFVRTGPGDLTSWAKQGVLLLNTVLTVKKNEPESHCGEGWENFTDAVIKYITENCEGIVFMLWGDEYQQKGKDIERQNILKGTPPYHLILRAGDPVAQSNYFFGSKHFSKANEHLKKQGKTEIGWQLHDPPLLNYIDMD